MAVLVHAQDVRLAEHDVRAQAEIRVIEQRVANLQRKLDGCADAEKVWALYGRNAHPGGGEKGAVARTPEAKNLHQLVLPTLTGPFSARRRAASKRRNVSIEDVGSTV
jgi:hypothetical protein